jgi:MoaA/NifB/PqqE/SkfB family radical SAM enzyme
VAFSKDAVNLFFHILTACNLACRHCYINPAQHGANRLPIETIEAWLRCFSHKASRANVIFLGGEPTLHPELSLAVKAARILGYQSVTVDTNGYLFHDILSRVTPSEVDFFSFSLDGATGAVNDAIRGRGAYETCLVGIEEARRRGFHTSLIYTVSAANIHELEQMPALLSELGIERFFIQVIGIRGRSAPSGGGTGQPAPGAQVSPRRWLEVIPRAAKAAARLGITVTYPKVYLEPGEPFACAGIAADNYFIFPNGRVYRCPLCEDYPLHSLALEEDRLVEMPKVNEADLFPLSIPEGCVMNRIIQPGNIRYAPDGTASHRIACCMLKEEVTGFRARVQTKCIS